MKAIKNKLTEIESEIERLQNDLQIANAMVYEGNEQLQKLLCSTSKNIKRKKIQSAQSKTKITITYGKNTPKHHSLIQIFTKFYCDFNTVYALILSSSTLCRRFCNTIFYNPRLILALRGKENIIMIWRGVGKKNKTL